MNKLQSLMLASIITVITVFINIYIEHYSISGSTGTILQSSVHIYLHPAVCSNQIYAQFFL